MQHVVSYYLLSTCMYAKSAYCCVLPFFLLFSPSHPSTAGRACCLILRQPNSCFRGEVCLQHCVHVEATDEERSCAFPYIDGTREHVAAYASDHARRSAGASSQMPRSRLACSNAVLYSWPNFRAIRACKATVWTNLSVKISEK